ncbi:sugar transferase [Vibrio sp. 10N.286.49.C2]|uniref:sugar transferase n=1 Tax=unclassified Vibrio TaxID=2614977 RepID=UPI000C8170B6|nr:MULTISPECIES: sugar transferase [unclassified Vibrio]PMH31414.1 sugar transferase [Vibrio sp. 10N.286.49.C2]PMH50435.1 sugar transferase [Vibrio sp. 10N.286.49.B1]PMH79770.1 sugar transferase [Vibrio sp. 10N.286.48.B7]
MKITTFEKPSIKVSKRIFDVIGASVGMLILACLFIPVALAIKLTSRGPIFYTQLRVGKWTPTKMDFIHVIKYRTMYIDAESRSGATWATEDDPRITPVGRFLRKTRLDELPQFINVLKGEMSLIGPRPERPDFYQRLENDIPYFVERTYDVLPGITGLAQVNQGYDTCIDDVRRKVGFDHSYALSLSSFKTWIITDVHIVILTLKIMVGRHGR